jgi:uncharacterized SAM-binding protein YcdF (DUF218 family)
MKWLVSVAALAIAFIVLVSVYLQPSSFTGCGVTPSETGECSHADAIVVVSGGDTRGRTQAGIDLYKNNWADTLIFSGAAQDKSGPSNAEAMMLQAVQAGIPSSAILIDGSSESTQQNAMNTQTIVSSKGYTDIILVTSGYHQRRASLEFNKQAESVEIRNYPVTHDGDWSWFWWLTPRGWWLAGGELVKIIAFYVGVTS